MRLLFDQNLFPELPRQLADIFPQSLHTEESGHGQSSDEAIWFFAKNEGLVIVSKDSDYRARSLLRGFPPKVIWVRIGTVRPARWRICSGRIPRRSTRLGSIRRNLRSFCGKNEKTSRGDNGP